MDYNKVTLIGRLGTDPNLRYTQGTGTAMCTFRIAVSERWGQGDEQREHTDWFSIVAWKDLAERIAKTLRRGARVLVDGRLRTREYEHQGAKRFVTEINAFTVIFLDPAPTAQGGRDYGVEKPSAHQPSVGGYGGGYRNAGQPPATPTALTGPVDMPPDFPNGNDDLPF